MTNFEKTLISYLAGKPPEYTSEVEYDVTIKDNPAMLKRNLTIIVAAVFIDKESNVLLIQEAKQGCRGEWYLPAGRLEENETIEEGAKREVKEEANVDFEPTSLICVENYPNAFSSWVRFTYTGNITGGKLKTTKQADKDSLQAKWFPLDAVQSPRSQVNLRARDVLKLVDACKTHQRLAATDQKIAPVIPKLQAYTHMCFRLMLVRKTNANFDVLICMSGTSTSHLPVVRDMGCCLRPTFQEIFGGDIDVLSHKGVLCVEHAGKSRQIYADGVCLTILVFATTTKDPKDGDAFVWHRIRNETIAADLDRRLKRHENSIPLFT
ncbi:8-oxo-dGDP phosphatase NUDT18-like [Amphiura filiformis]|uniref:8-oxo-dGDP phosphatase NUDT18-like n=1 Tax=Amphiura filiformis TaxID=82378 RepID=UPI003B21CF3E